MENIFKIETKLLLIVMNTIFNVNSTSLCVLLFLNILAQLHVPCLRENFVFADKFKNNGTYFVYGENYTKPTIYEYGYLFTKSTQDH